MFFYGFKIRRLLRVAGFLPRVYFFPQLLFVEVDFFLFDLFFDFGFEQMETFFKESGFFQLEPSPHDEHFSLLRIGFG